VSDHGTVALINGLAKAREKASNSFIYSPGVTFYERYEDKGPATEVDAICLIDGELWIGEVKSNVREFSKREMKKLVSDTKKLGGDKAFVYAEEGDQECLGKRCQLFSASEGIEMVQLYPSGFAALPAYHL
jgi:hypothetical protein